MSGDVSEVCSSGFTQNLESMLSLAELWYNSTYHSYLGCSPFKALYGYEPNMGATPVLSPTTSPTLSEIVEHREQHLQAIKTHLAAPQNRMKNRSPVSGWWSSPIEAPAIHPILDCQPTISQAGIQILQPLQDCGSSGQICLSARTTLW